MTIGLLILGFILGLVAGYALISRRHRPRYLATAEYWVYLPDEILPEQEAIMNRMIGANPYAKRGRSPIGPAEGLVFSDVRLHIALVLRSKNPHVFRPDLFSEYTEPSPEHLATLAEAKALAKVRYVSEEPLPDKRHLQFLAHAADAIAELGGGRVIYDVSAERLLARTDLSEMLAESLDASRYEVHTRVVWGREGEGGFAQTRGLVKIGLSELRTGAMEPDERVLVTSVLEEAARKIWDQGAIPEAAEVSAYDDRFRVTFQPPQQGYASVRILRVQTA